MKIKHILLTAIAFLLFACNSETETVLVKREAYSVELPGYLSETNMLNEEASLQYQNLLKPLFAIVLDEPKADVKTALQENGLEDLYSAGLDGYAELVASGFQDHLGLDNETDFKETTINGMNALTADINGVIDSENIYWKIAYLEGKNNYYQLLVWTTTENKKNYQKDMEAIINSFKEIDKSKK